MTGSQREKAPWEWRWGEDDAVLHGLVCRGNVTLTRSEPDKGANRARCERCGQRWERRDARCNWTRVS